MHTTYRLNASELDEHFLEELKKTYQDREIEIVVSELDETDYLMRSEVNRERMLASKRNIENGTSLAEVSLKPVG